jgi:hypothetical protein
MSALSANDDEVPFDSGLAVSIACITVNVIAKIGQRRGRFLALLGLARRGRALPLCPGTADVNLFGDGECVIDLDAKIAHCALDLFVPQQKLYSPQIAGTAIDEGCFGSAP